MNVLTANLRAIVPAVLRGGLLLVLAAAGTTLWGQGQQRIASASVTINVTTGGGPVIDTFTVSDFGPNAGETVTFNWTTTNADKVLFQRRRPEDTSFITLGTYAGDDSATQVMNSPTAKINYRIEAFSGTNSVTSSPVSVAWGTPGTISIDSFTVDTQTPGRGKDVTFSWETTNATYVQLQSFEGLSWVSIGGNRPADGKAKISNPGASRNYQIIAWNGSTFKTSSSISITWPRPPQEPCSVDSFSASPSTITEGGKSTLSWSTSDATSASIDQGVGTVTAASGSTSVSPSSTTTYKLTARGPGGSCSDSVTVTVKPPPCSVDSFSASPSTITAGGKSTLSWSTSDATIATIDQGVGLVKAASGSTIVRPGSTTTYKLTARGPGGSCSDSVTVTVPPPCVIDSFGANPSTIPKGGKSTLSWTTTDATSVSIPGTTGTLSVNDSTTVSPTSTTTYTLTCSGAGGDDTASVKVTVLPPCEIDSFSANPSTITEGGKSTLSWTTTNATSVSIPGTTGTLSVDGSTTVSPTSTTTYTLTAGGSSCTPDATDTTSVTVIPRPPTASLYADPDEIFNAGIDPVTLTWSTTDATSASIDEGVGSVTPVADGSTTVYPDTTTTYTLTATGPGGSASDTATVYTIDSQRTLTATLVASANTITRGGSTTLSWTTKGADSATIDQGIGAVTPVASGSVSVSPTATTTYTLTATSGEGDDAVSVTDSVTITVTAP